MRQAFARTLTELAERDPRILLLTGDLGYMALEPFAERFPGRFVNVGVAEQNLVGLATGLAEGGFIPFVYSIVPFVTLRAYEFIRNGPVQHRLPVRIVGMGGGFEYGTNGLSHYGIEDLGVMRIQPGMTVLAPADHAQAAAALRATWDLPGPVYYRLGKDDRTVVPGLDGRFELGKAARIGDGRDVLLLATGSVAAEAEQALRLLASEGLRGTLLVVAGLSPAPEADLAEALARFRVVLTVEAHYRVGGLGSLVAERIAERGWPCRLIRCGVSAAPDGISGSTRFLHARHGISSEAVAAAAKQAFAAHAGEDIREQP
jgi:transketolase